MASIIKFSIDLNKIPKDKIIEGKKGMYLPMTVTINNEVDQYGNQGPVVVEQSKDEREAEVPKTYLGNAKVVWTDGKNVEKAPWVEQDKSAGKTRVVILEDDGDDLPF